MNIRRPWLRLRQYLAKTVDDLLDGRDERALVADRQAAILARLQILEAEAAVKARDTKEPIE